MSNMLKRIRLLKQMSQRELSTLSGVSNAELSRIETGERANPSPILLQRIADALEINYLDLYLEYGYIKENDYLVMKLYNTDKINFIKLMRI